MVTKRWSIPKMELCSKATMIKTAEHHERVEVIKEQLVGTFLASGSLVW